MKYLDLVEKLQNKEENSGYIVIIKNGIFFISVGKDAIIMNKLVNLKLTCMKENLCKVGFLIKSTEKYMEKLKEENKSFVIYDYNKEQEKEEEIIRYNGELIFEKSKCKTCNNCANKKETEQDIIERLKNNANK